MKILVAPNPFKESLTAKRAAQSIAAGLQTSSKSKEIVQLPLSDGGEGFMEAMTSQIDFKEINQVVLDPLGRQITASFRITENETAIIEMAKASGLELVEKSLRNPLSSTTYGTGQLIKKAVELGAKQVIIGIGGSATNDGGAGMAQAIGSKLLRQDGTILPMGAKNLLNLSTIDNSELDERIKDIKFIVASDVLNPLLGPNGASNVYGPQKGASTSQIEILEENLRHFDAVAQRDLGTSFAETHGSGAAGGLGYGLMTFLNATLESGFELVSRVNKLETIISDSDLVITGEGRLDAQTMNGKTIKRLSELCQKLKKPLIIICGIYDKSITDIQPINESIQGVYQIMGYAKNIEDAMNNASFYLELISQEISHKM